MTKAEINALSKERMWLSIRKREIEKQVKPYLEAIAAIDEQLREYIDRLANMGEKDFDPYWNVVWRVPKEVDEKKMKAVVGDKEWAKYRQVKSEMNQYVLAFPKMGKAYLMPKKDAPAIK